MATSPEERKRGNRSPGTNTTQSGDGKIDLTVGVGGKGDSSPQPKSKTLRITQPVISSGNFGEILTGSNSPNPTPEGGTGQVSITVQNKFPADSGLNGQYRHIYSTSASGLPKKVVGPWITFPVGGVTSASFVWNCPADIDNKSNIEVRTVYTPSKSILYTKRIPVSTTDQLLPPTFTSLPVLSTSTPILGNTISVSGFVGSGNPVPSASYQWYQNSSAVSGATSASFTTTATGGVSAEVILTNSQGTLSATAGAIVGTIPSFIITPSASATGVTLGTTVTINNIGTTGSQPITYSYEWRMTSPTATPIAGATSQSYTTGISGTTLYGIIKLVIQLISEVFTTMVCQCQERLLLSQIALDHEQWMPRLLIQALSIMKVRRLNSSRLEIPQILLLLLILATFMVQVHPRLCSTTLAPQMPLLVS